MAVDEQTPDEELALLIGYGQIDLQIEEYLRHMEEDVLSSYEVDDEDRAMLVYLMRLSYIQGHKDGRLGVVPAQGL
jgi:hypothetical protein